MRLIRLRLAVVGAILAVPLVGMFFGGLGGTPLVLLSGGLFFLAYLFAIRTALGSVIAGPALLGLTIGTEVYVIGRWPESSTAALGYLYIPLGAPPVLAVTLMAEALAQPLRLDSARERRRISPAIRSLAFAEVLALIWWFLTCLLFAEQAWCLASIVLVAVGTGAIATRLLLDWHALARR